MSLFKMTWLLLLILTTGCFRTANDNPKSSAHDDGRPNVASNFRALEVTGTSINFKSHPEWEIPVEKTYEFRVCLISKATQQQLPSGQTFEVVLPSGVILDIDDDKTDDLGCINWQEDQPFDFTGESVYLGKRRLLRAKSGAYNGSVDLHIGVNPWAEYRNENVPEVVDLNRRRIALNRLVPENLSDPLRAGVLGRGESSRLYFEHNPAVNVTSIRDIADGKRVRVIVRMRPFIMPLSMNGMTPEPRPLTAGCFRIFANLMSANVGVRANRHTILASLYGQSNVGNGRLGYSRECVHGTGVLTLEMNFDLKREIHMGEVQLALKIDPLNSPMSLSSHEGLYTLGTFTELFSSNLREEIRGSYSNREFSYGAYLRSSINFEELKDQGFGDDLQPIYFEPLEPRFIRIGAGETATRRTVIYRVQTFVRDSIDGSAVKMQPFKITKHLESTEEIERTDRLGRLVWFNELEHLYYQAERYFHPRFTLEQVSSGYTEVREAVVNPWDEGWTFGADPQNIEEEYNDLANQQVRHPLLMADAFRYQTIRFRYVIDENMILNVKKAVVMALDPLVQKFSIKEGRKIFEPLRDGIYLAHVALVKKYLDPFDSGDRLVRLENDEGVSYVLKRVSESEDARRGHFSTVVKKLLRVQAGRVTTPLEFSMRDLRMMSIRSNLLVQLETIDEDKLLRDNTVYQLLEEQMEEYVRINSANMTDQERADFLAEKREQLEAERSRLRSFIEEEREALDDFRGERNRIFQQRYDQLSDFEERLSEETLEEEMSEHMSRLEELYQLSTQEYRDYRAGVMSNLVEMHESLDSYWGGAATEWERNAEEDIDNAQENRQPPMIPDNQTDFYNNEFDYFFNISEFVDSNGYPLSLGADTLEKLELNNYTINPAAPFVDLDLYVDEESGLPKRTFIGPCTLIENDNMSELRPTDTLDELHAERIDSGQRLFTPRIEPPDNSIFEDSAYHGSFKPYGNWHIDDDAIPFHIENEIHYERSMLARSTLGRFVDLYNLNYVSLDGDEPIKKFVDGCSFETEEECFEETTEHVLPINDFLNFASWSEQALLARFFKLQPPYRLEHLESEVISSQNMGNLWDLATADAERMLSLINRADTSITNTDSRYASEHIETHGEVPFDTERIDYWVTQGISKIELSDALRVCELLSNQAMNTLASKNLLKDDDQRNLIQIATGRATLRRARNYLLNVCLSKVRYIPNTNRVFFDGVAFERRKLIYETGKYVHNSGRNMNLNVGANFSLSNYKDLSQSLSLSAGAGAKFSVFGTLGGEVGITRASTQATGANQAHAVDVATAVFLVVQEANMDIYIRRHEKCLNLQFSPELLRDLTASRLRLNDNVNLFDKEVYDSITKGFFICTGGVVENDDEENPDIIKENYYYVSQHFTAGDMLDEGNLLNHVWLLAIRGDRDFLDFMTMVDGPLKLRTGEIVHVDSKYKYPLDQLNRVYTKVLPSFPGMYTVPEPHPQMIIEGVE